MKRFLVLILLFGLTITPTIASVQAQTTPVFRSGLNYLSSGNRFSQEDSVTEADFVYFKANGITDISIRIFWKSFIEDPNLIANYKRLLTIADKYGMKVQFDFWTSDWSRPTHLSSINDIIRIPEVKQQWLSFVSTVLRELKSFKCIQSWTMMNEPHDLLPGDTALFYQCWQQQRSLMRSIDRRPISIRFALGDSPWSGNFSKTQVFKVCDYIAINEYLDPSNSSDTRWKSTWDQFYRCISDCRSAHKALVFSEFGSDTGDDEAKRVWYEKTLSLFRSKGILKAYAFSWQTLNPLNERFNIAGKPAFQELVEADGLRVRNSW
jgi:hypothetical protein